MRIGYSLKKYGAGTLRPSGDRSASSVSPLWHYRWVDTERALRNLADVQHDPFDGVMLDYVNPLTGRHALPSIACRFQLLAAGLTTATHRHTGHWVYHVVQGSGATTIEDVRYAWNPGDFFLVPPWCWHRDQVAAGEDAVLFSMSDTAMLERLGLHREEAQVDNLPRSCRSRCASESRSNATSSAIPVVPRRARPGHPQAPRFITRAPGGAGHRSNHLPQ